MGLDQPWNVFAVLLRMFSSVKEVQYCGRMFSTVGDVQYFEGCSVVWRMFSCLEDVQYFGGCSVFWRMFISMEDVHFYGGCSVLRRMFSTVGASGHLFLHSHLVLCLVFPFFSLQALVLRV